MATNINSKATQYELKQTHNTNITVAKMQTQIIRVRSMLRK